jgi:metal-sulfur cluster biosynthetic enzyme
LVEAVGPADEYVPPNRQADKAGVSEAIIAALRSVYDPCCREKGISVVDMGLIESIELDGEGAKIELVLTSGWCPFAVDLLGMIREKVESLPEVGGAAVEVVWEKAWSMERLSDDAHAKLRFLPNPKNVRDRAALVESARRSASPITVKEVLES